MSQRIVIVIKESREALQSKVKGCADHLRPRIRMLLFRPGGITTTKGLVRKLKVNKNSIADGKKTYREGGLAGLLQDHRGAATTLPF